MGREALLVDEAREDDVEAIVEVDRRSFPVAWSRDLFRREREMAHLRVLRDPAAGVVAFSCFRDVVDDVELERLAVDPDWRRRSIGRRLVADVVDHARAVGAARVILEVGADNVGARSFYEREGFVETGRRRGYYGGREDAVLLDLPIGNVVGPRNG